MKNLLLLILFLGFTANEMTYAKDILRTYDDSLQSNNEFLNQVQDSDTLDIIKSQIDLTNCLIYLSPEDYIEIKNSEIKIEPVIIYPNPSDGSINFKTPININSIYLVNINGSLTKKIYVEGTGVINLNLKKYGPGTYVLIFKTDRNTWKHGKILII